MKHLTAAARDAVLATGIPAWDVNRHTAAVRKATRNLTVLAEAAALRGTRIEEAVWAGYFKLSANEPQRLPALVASIENFRLDDVARGLLAYNANH